MARFALLVAFSSCAVIDRLDGQIDDLDHCCAALTTDGVRACVVRLHDRAEGEAFCSVAYCEPPIDDVEVFVDEQGAVFASCPDNYLRRTTSTVCGVGIVR